jgi:hypothetical protein
MRGVTDVAEGGRAARTAPPQSVTRGGSQRRVQVACCALLAPKLFQQGGWLPSRPPFPLAHYLGVRHTPPVRPTRSVSSFQYLPNTQHGQHGRTMSFTVPGGHHWLRRSTPSSPPYHMLAPVDGSSLACSGCDVATPLSGCHPRGTTHPPTGLFGVGVVLPVLVEACSS